MTYKPTSCINDDDDELEFSAENSRPLSFEASYIKVVYFKYSDEVSISLYEMKSYKDCRSVCMTLNHKQARDLRKMINLIPIDCDEENKDECI